MKNFKQYFSLLIIFGPSIVWGIVAKEENKVYGVIIFFAGAYLYIAVDVLLKKIKKKRYKVNRKRREKFLNILYFILFVSPYIVTFLFSESWSESIIPEWVLAVYPIVIIIIMLLSLKYMLRVIVNRKIKQRPKAAFNYMSWSQGWYVISDRFQTVLPKGDWVKMNDFVIPNVGKFKCYYRVSDTPTYYLERLRTYFVNDLYDEEMSFSRMRAEMFGGVSEDDEARQRYAEFD